MAERTLAVTMQEEPPQGSNQMIPQEAVGGADNRLHQREREIDQIREALRGLRYGTVQVIVQDGVVVQIDRLEKRRLRAPEQKAQRP